MVVDSAKGTSFDVKFSCEFEFFVFRVFFYTLPATTVLYTLSYTTLFRSGGAGARGGPRPRRGVEPCGRAAGGGAGRADAVGPRSEEHTSELSHVERSYAVFCLKKKKQFAAHGCR